MQNAHGHHKTFGLWQAFLLKGRDGSFVRSTKRAYYQPDSPRAPEEPPNKKREIAYGVYVSATIFLLICAFPVGLVLLWLKKFRIGGLAKMGISVAGCVAFLALFTLFINVQGMPEAISSAQVRVRAAVSFYGADSKEIVEGIEGRLRAFPEDLSNVTFHSIRYGQRALANGIGALSKRHDQIAGKVKDLAYVALIRVSDELSKVFPEALKSPEEVDEQAADLAKNKPIHYNRGYRIQ